MPQSRSELARRIARCIGLKTFKGRSDRPILLNDCESVAWELERSAPPDVKAASIAFIAVKRVRIGRQHRESVRSITTGRYDKRSKRPKNLRQIHVLLNDVVSPEQPPSMVVPGWMDYQSWLRQLDARKRAVASALSAGGRTGEVAREFDVSPGRIAQMRRELEADWKEFQPAS